MPSRHFPLLTAACAHLSVWPGRYFAILVMEETLGEGCAYRKRSIDACWVRMNHGSRLRGGSMSSPSWLSSLSVWILRPCLCFSGSPSAHFPKAPHLCPLVFLSTSQFNSVLWGLAVRDSTTEPSALGRCEAAGKGRLRSSPRKLQEKSKWCGKGLKQPHASSQAWRGMPALTSFVLQGTGLLGLNVNQQVKR